MSDLPLHTVEIDDLEIRTVQFSVMRALPMWVRVSNLLAPAFDCLDRMDPKDLGRLKDLAEKDELTLGDVLNLLPLLAPFLRTLDADIVLRVAREVFTATTVIKAGKKIDLGQGDPKINAAFGTNMAQLLRALWFAGRVNFKGFTGAGANDESPPADAP